MAWQFYIKNGKVQSRTEMDKTAVTNKEHFSTEDADLGAADLGALIVSTDGQGNITGLRVDPAYVAPVVLSPEAVLLGKIDAIASDVKTVKDNTKKG